MPPHELLVDVPSHGLEVAVSLLREQQREEVDLEEQVAQLVEQLRRVVREHRIRDLVGLLDRVRDDRARGLLPIPGALPAKVPGEVLEVEERLREAHRGDPTGWCQSERRALPAARSPRRS